MQQPSRPPDPVGLARSTQFGQINASELMFAPETKPSLRRFRLKSSGVWAVVWPGFDRGGSGPHHRRTRGCRVRARGLQGFAEASFALWTLLARTSRRMRGSGDGGSTGS